MEGLMTFTGIVIIAFGILQIILFFKVWGMTNDVKTMKDELVGSNSKDLRKIQLNKCILKGNKNKIADLLFDMMFNDIQSCYNKSLSYSGGETYFITQISTLKKEYKEKYSKYGINFPEAIDKIEKLKDIENL
ncbi:hypothetical protein DWW69_16150 [Bacteroides sp. AF16-49]|uniref:hypothetical protein n=1 Tax=Bacteroides sp. AF16-49 TaxID=2292192 RepID=UPI000EFE9EC9|nr:hypothetical protein [Bacteroides sp. AF16-49]RHR72427.1 hypothetical protein DWW69_16150 [Bacteroides sp. AF16-49]